MNTEIFAQLRRRPTMLAKAAKAIAVCKRYVRRYIAMRKHRSCTKLLKHTL